MIMELRKHDYGKFQIHKNRGEPYRLITSASYQLDPNQYDDDFSPEIIS